MSVHTQTMYTVLITDRIWYFPITSQQINNVRRYFFSRKVFSGIHLARREEFEKYKQILNIQWSEVDLNAIGTLFIEFSIQELSKVSIQKRNDASIREVIQVLFQEVIALTLFENWTSSGILSKNAIFISFRWQFFDTKNKQELVELYWVRITLWRKFKWRKCW